jgi:hypothetical protein
VPRSFQPEMIDHLVRNEEAMLWCSMGTGKTVCLLTAISRLILEGGYKGALIVAPIRVMAITFPDQIARWEHTKWMRLANLRTKEGIKAWEEGSAQIYMINPEKLNSVERKGKKYPGFVEKYLKKKNVPVDIFVHDESSTSKSPNSKRFNTLRPFLHDLPRKNFKTPFRRRWSMTGTPAPNSYLDIHAQVRLIDNGKRLGVSHHQYKQAFFDSDWNGWKWEIKPGAKEKIDARIADLALVMMGDDLLDLPHCSIVDVDVALPAQAKEDYRILEKELLVQLDTGELEALSAAALVTKLLQMTAGCAYDSERKVHLVHAAKLKALHSIRKKHPREPLLVLTSYIHERERLLKEFPEAEEFNEKDMDRWRAGEISMWVSNAKSLCHGIDGLQDSCRILVWMTGTYSNEAWLQSNARLVRMGQEHETIIYRVIARGTIDEAVVEVLRQKDAQQDGLMRSVRALRALKETS